MEKMSSRLCRESHGPGRHPPPSQVHQFIQVKLLAPLARGFPFPLLLILPTSMANSAPENRLLSQLYLANKEQYHAKTRVAVGVKSGQTSQVDDKALLLNET